MYKETLMGRRTTTKNFLSPAIISFSVSNFSLRQECVWISLNPSHVAPRFFSLSLPPPIPPSSPSLWFELDNENNEFGVCFFLCVSRPPPLLSLHLARPVSLSHGDPVSYSLAHARKPPTFISLLRISSVCFVVFPPCAQISPRLSVSSPFLSP